MSDSIKFQLPHDTVLVSYRQAASILAVRNAELIKLKAEITELQNQVGRLSANYLLVLSEGNEEIAMLKAVTEAFASVASEEGVREMLLSYVQGAMALEALEALKESEVPNALGMD